MAQSQEELLQAILSALEGGGGAAGASTPPARGPLAAGAGDEDALKYADLMRKRAAEQQQEAQDRIKALADERAIRGELTADKEREFEALIKMAAAYKEVKLAADDALGAAISGLEDTAKAQKDAATAQEELNRQFDAGAEKADLLTDNMFQFSGVAEKLTRVLPTAAAELSGLTSKFTDSEWRGLQLNKMFIKIAAESLNLAFASDEAAAGFRRTTGAVQNGMSPFNNYATAMSSVRNETAALGGTHADAAGAMGSLYTEMSSFTQLSQDQQIALTAQSVALEKLGVNNSQVSLIFDQATKSLGFNESELVGLTEHLHDVAQSLGKSTKQVFADFQAVSKQLAFYGTDVVDVFDKLSKQSKSTGLSVSELVGISGQAFDTFDGAAQKVGRLNAILGGPYLNSIDMLNASEADRIELLKESMDASGQMFSDMNKYEQLAIADALGVDVDTARRMFGELSAAEELQIKNQEDIAETAREAQAMMAKLSNAVMSLIVAMDPLIQIVSYLIEGLSRLLAMDYLEEWTGSKMPAAIVRWTVTIVGLTWAIGLLWKKLKGGTSILSKITKPFKSAGNAVGGFFSGGAEGAAGGAEATGGFISKIKEFMEAIKGSAKELLAFGAAILMIGGGIGLAALGLAQLVSAFEDLTGPQILGALTALIIVGILFSVMLYILSTASLTAVGPMLALGLAFLLIGAGIALAAYGMSLLVAAFGELNGGQLIAAAIGITVFSIAMYLLIAAAVASTAAAPAILALALLLVAIGVAALLMAIAITIAAKGMAAFVEAISKIPPKTLFQIALGIGALGVALIILAVGLYVAAVALVVMAAALLITMPIIALSTIVLFAWAISLIAVGIALVVVGYGLSQLVKNLLLIPPALILKTAAAFGALGIALIVLAVGLVASAIGFGLLAISLLFAAPILAASAIALAIFGASLLIVGVGMVMVAYGATKLAIAMVIMAKSMPILREFAAALREIGGAALGIVATAAAMGALTLSLGPFGLALLVLNRKKLEALTDFNKSATLTVNTVQKPAIPTESIKATEARMGGAPAAAVGGGAVSKPVITFAQKSILVKIGDRELKDVIIEVLKDPAVGRAISGFGSG